MSSYFSFRASYFPAVVVVVVVAVVVFVVLVFVIVIVVFIQYRMKAQNKSR